MTRESAPRRWWPWSLGGLVLVVGGGLSYFSFFARFPALRDVPVVNLPLVALGVAAAAFGAFGAWRRPRGWIGRIAATACLAAALPLAALFALYVFDFSYRLPNASAALAVGERAPAFELANQDGETVRLDDLRGRTVVLVFYRGFW